MTGSTNPANSATRRQWGTALLCAAAAVFVVGCIAWVFPRATTALAGDWVLPVASLAALVLALALAAEWPVLQGALLVLAIMLVSSWNRASVTSTSHFAGAALGCMVMTALGRSATTSARLRLAMLAFLSGGLAMMLVGFVGSSARSGSVLESILERRLPPIRLGLEGLHAGGDVNPNALAAAVLLVVPVGVTVLLFARRDRVDWWTLVPAGLAVVVIATLTLAVTRSKTALIAVWVIALSLLVRGMPSRWHRLIAGLVVLAPLLFLTARLSVIAREDALLDTYNSWLATRVRAQILSQAFDKWKQSPWTGIGLNEFRHVYVPRPDDVPQEKDIAHAHNIFMQTALDIGVIGSAAYWTVLVFLWARARQAAREPSPIGRAAAVGGAFCLIAAILFGLTDAVPLGSKVGTFQWMAGGLILAASRIGFDPANR